MLDGFTRPLIRPLLTVALYRDGRTPRALLLLVASMRSSPGIRTFIEGGLSAPLAYLRVSGSARLRPTPRTPTARYEVRWQSASAELDPAL